MSRHGENEEEAAARIDTTVQTIRQLMLVGVVLLGLLGAPVLLWAWMKGQGL